MNQPTDIAAVRAAADRIKHNTIPPSADDEQIGYSLAADQLALALYALATIPADAHLPIDAAWLREVWGWRGDGTMSMHYDRDEWTALCWSDDGVSFVAKTIGVRVYTKVFPITTRHQFTQLAACLGIQPQTPTAKETQR